MKWAAMCLFDSWKSAKKNKTKKKTKTQQCNNEPLVQADWFLIGMYIHQFSHDSEIKSSSRCLSLQKKFFLDCIGMNILA